jgi:hypothetical protein
LKSKSFAQSTEFRGPLRKYGGWRERPANFFTPHKRWSACGGKA